VYVPTEGSEETDSKKFDQMVEGVMKRLENRDLMIFMGDLNARRG
jgi:hypothetical protein